VRVVEAATAQLGWLRPVLRSTVTVGPSVVVTVVVKVWEVSQLGTSPAFEAVTSTLKLAGQPEPLWHVTVNVPVVESTAPA
jgi:hypothetical protein